MSKFKLNQNVIIKEVNREYGRTEKQVKILEEIKNKEEIGKVLSIDEGDSYLNIYVSFSDSGNIWLNEGEIETFVDTDCIFKELFGNKFVDPLIEQPKRELTDKVKAQLFDKLIGANQLDYEAVYEDWVTEQASEMYTDFVMEYLEIDLEHRKLLRKAIEFLLIIFYVLNLFLNTP